MPQLILIMTDTQRKDMLGCYGYPDMKTPALDSLAAAGLRFDRAYCCQPVCGPARAALFTGIFPHTTGAWGNLMPLGDIYLTVGQRLARAGLHAAYIGKWHLDAGDYFGTGQCPNGWDAGVWYDMRNYLEELTPRQRLISRSAKLNQDPNLTADFTFGHRCSNRAIDFISKHKSEDFLLVISYDEPHDPYICPRPFSQMYKDYEFPKRPAVWDALRDKPEHQRVWAGNLLDADKDALKIRQADYLGCNSFIDSEIGRVIEAIQKHTPDALVIYTSDHGEMLASHSLTNKGPAMYDEITNIPLIVSWPGNISPGGKTDQPISHIDLTPTILDYFNVPAPANIQGKSLLPALRDPSHKINDAVFMEFGRYEIDHDGFGGFQPIRSIMDGRYKLVINLLSTDEFYDLTEDPDEIQNLIASPASATQRNRLHDRLLAWMNETRDPFRGYYWHRRPWRADAPEPTWDYTAMTRQRIPEKDEPGQLDYSTGLAITEFVRKKPTL